jgi:hypothetical protein
MLLATDEDDQWTWLADTALDEYDGIHTAMRWVARQLVQHGVVGKL